MIDLTKICIGITHFLIIVGWILATVFLTPLFGVFSPLFTAVIFAPAVVMWFMATTAWKRYMFGE